MPAFLRSPRWLAGHVLVLVTVVSFANLGLWQLRRLEERQAYNALLTERLAQPPAALGDVLGSDPEASAYRRTQITGTFRHDLEVLLSTRSSNGRPGHHVLTPLATEEVVVFVDRGWVPLDHDDPPVAEATPPSGEVTVDGILFPSSQARRFGTFDGGAGRLQFVSAVDLSVLSELVSAPLLPLWLLAQEQEPGQGGALPVPAEAPELTEGSHLSYAVQWFLFALVVVVGYPLLLLRVHRDPDDGSRPPASARETPIGVP